MGKYLQFAKELLKYFVKEFGNIYGQHLISQNIHGLLHLCDDYKQFGALDNTSCFPFENFMKYLKSMLRKHDKPLEQIIKRYKEIQINNIGPYHIFNKESIILKHEHINGPMPQNIKGLQYKTLILNDKCITIKINSVSDSYIGTTNNVIIQVVNIVKDNNAKQILIIGNVFKCKNDLYLHPIKSSKLGIFIISHISKNISIFNIETISKKYIVFNKGQTNIAIPIYHSE